MPDWRPDAQLRLNTLRNTTALTWLPPTPPASRILTGEDLRPGEERRPDWAGQAEPIVARALTDELKHAQLFSRVKNHAGTVNPKKYPELVKFRVKKFECYNRPAFLETTGRDLLRLQGLRGELIAESIPTKYISEVEVEFEVMDAATQKIIFVRDYSATRTGSANGYQGADPQIQQTSAALESVITQFITDLSRIPRYTTSQ